MSSTAIINIARNDTKKKQYRKLLSKQITDIIINTDSKIDEDPEYAPARDKKTFTNTIQSDTFNSALLSNTSSTDLPYRYEAIIIMRINTCFTNIISTPSDRIDTISDKANSPP
ncbi:hypothetical protein GCM10007941_29370 [Amphritea balenae]|nr:hypothetical protein GCM10007941_29370 [Amphritea balenae]